MKDIVILGSGGLAREIAWLIDENNKIKKEWNILGYISQDSVIDEKEKYSIIGNDEWLQGYKGTIYAVCAIGNEKIRKNIVHKYKKYNNIKFPPIISHQAILSNEILIGEGTIICAGVIITINVRIGAHCIINLNSTIGHDTVLEDYVTINPGTNISGGCVIETECNIGTGTKLIQNIRIGENTIIGAGSVVVREIPKGVIAVGCPARQIKNNI